jgi:hypothetical protein
MPCVALVKMSGNVTGVLGTYSYPSLRKDIRRNWALVLFP